MNGPKTKCLRRPGSPWRLLVHEYIGKQDGNPRTYGISHNVSSQPSRTREPSEWSSEHTLEGTEFDELVVGQWIHIEQMDTSLWWMNVGGVTINVRADRDGRPKHVAVFGPSDYTEPVESCEYELTWSYPKENQ